MGIVNWEFELFSLEKIKLILQSILINSTHRAKKIKIYIFQELVLPNSTTGYQEWFKFPFFVYYLTSLDTLITYSRYYLETTLFKRGELDLTAAKSRIKM